MQKQHPSSIAEPTSRRLPIGAEVTSGGGVHFRVWAPRRTRVEVILSDGTAIDLSAEADGYFSGWLAEVSSGDTYQYRLDSGPETYPDPASRFQPSGPHGPSEVVDHAFQWTDAAFPGVPAHGQVLYEMHIGTFTQEGTWAAAAERLSDLKDLGITCLEVMPINEFCGRWGWGYDGVGLFAPFHRYGSPEDVRRFVNRAHELGLGVILDVVYNHFGPDGNYTSAFSNDYASHSHMTDWGAAINFDGPNSRSVREFFVTNARYWIEEFHFDGFRFDATQAIVDDSPRHILADITESAREAGQGKQIYLVNENEPQLTKLVRSTDRGGLGMDALWNDDFHHSAMVAVSSHNEAYYTDYLGTPQEFISAAKYGFLFQGQRYRWQQRRRGTPSLDLPPSAFVHFLQNHDQIANSARGYRAHHLTSPSQLRAMTALLLLMPQTPMLFQGQEWCASSPFLYFADHNKQLAELICKGRAREICQFPSAAIPSVEKCANQPGDETTFTLSRLDHDEKMRPFHSHLLEMHRQLLRIRREDPTIGRLQQRGDIDGAVLGPDALVLRYFGPTHEEDRLLLLNLGRDLPLQPSPEPLLAPPLGMRWQELFTSEDPAFGGCGSPPVDTELEGWLLHGRCAVLCRPIAASAQQIESRFRSAGSAQEARVREQRLVEQEKSEKERNA